MEYSEIGVTGIEAVNTAVDYRNFINISTYYGHLKAETVPDKALKHIDYNRYY